MALFDVEPLPGYDPEIGILLAGLQDSTREWREELGKPSARAIVWQARPGGHSIGSVILHIIDVEAYWFETFAAGVRRDPAELKLLLSKEVKQYGGKWPLPHEKTVAWYYDLHDRIRARAFGALKGIEPTKRLERRNYGVTLRWVVAHVLEHDAYHGGQAVLLHDLWKANHRAMTKR